MTTKFPKLASAVVFGLTSVAGTSLPANAEEITIYATEIEGLHQADGKGYYDEILASIKTTASLNVKVLPPSRSTVEFERCDSCCLTPANTNPDFYDFPAGYLESSPMTEAKVYIWTAPGTEPINSMAALAGKRVGARQGMPYGNTVDESGIKFDLASTINQNIKKLEAGRLDAFVAYVPDAYTAFEEMGKKPFPHDEANPISVHDDNIVCKPSDTNKKFLSEFDAQLGQVQ